MMKADLLSVLNKITQLNNMKKSKSILSDQNANSDSNFNQLLSQLLGQNAQATVSKPNDNNPSKQLPTDKGNTAIKYLSFDLLNSILQYLKSKASDSKPTLSSPQTQRIDNLLKELSQLLGQNAQATVSKPNDNNPSKQLPTDKGNTAIKYLSFDLLNSILQYLKSKASDSKPTLSSPQTQRIDNLLKELSQLLGQNAHIAVTKPNDNNPSKQLPTDKSNTAIHTKNENNIPTNPYENTAMSANIINYTKSKSSDSQNLPQTDQSFSNNLTPNMTLNNQTKKSDSLNTQPQGSPNKVNNAFNDSSPNILIEHAKSSNIAKNNVVSILNQNGQTAGSNGKQQSTLNQDSTPISVKYSLQAQNDNAASANTQILKNSTLFSALYDSKTNNQKTSNTNQASQPKGISISIDPKSLQIVSKDTNQPALILYKAIQKGQETQLNVIDKTKGNLVNNENKNLQQESINFQTTSQMPQAKSINSPSSNMQAMIDKILEIKNLTPPVIKTITIQVNPPSLGNIDLKVSIDSSKNLTANINVQSQDLFDAINKNLDSLKNILQNQGFNITQINLLNTKNDAQQSFYQNNQSQQNFNNSFSNFNQGSNHRNSNQQGNFSQAFNQKQEDNKQFSYNIDNKLISGGKRWSNSFIIDINI